MRSAAIQPCLPSPVPVDQSGRTLRRRLSRADILNSRLQATRTAAVVFTVLIGALLLGHSLTVTGTPQKVTEFKTGLGLGRYGVLAWRHSS